MENNNSYFGGAAKGIKSLLTGFGVTWKEYFTPKVTEQYPENRKTTLHVSERHRGRLVMPHDAEGNHKCIACTLCEKACPAGAIIVTENLSHIDESLCLSCGQCAVKCPRNAIVDLRGILTD